MERKEMQDKDIMSLEDEKWPLWSKKEGNKARKWGMKQDSAAWKFRTQKSNGIIYSDFEDKFGALSGIHYIYTLYIVSKLGKSGVQGFKRFANRS